MRIVVGFLLLFIATQAARAAFVFQKVAETGTGSPFSQITNPSVGADGTVVFQATTSTGVSGVYAWKNGQLATIADTTQGYSSFATIPAVNAHGDVAFVARLTDGTTGVYRYSSGSLTTIVNSATGLTPFFASPSMNDSGQVAFIENANRMVYVGDGLNLQNYNIGSSPPMVINNNGIVAVGASDGAIETDGTTQDLLHFIPSAGPAMSPANTR